VAESSYIYFYNNGGGEEKIPDQVRDDNECPDNDESGMIRRGRV